LVASVGHWNSNRPAVGRAIFMLVSQAQKSHGILARAQELLNYNLQKSDFFPGSLKEYSPIIQQNPFRP
jgi:hypothetical protein